MQITEAVIDRYRINTLPVLYNSSHHTQPYSIIMLPVIITDDSVGTEKASWTKKEVNFKGLQSNKILKGQSLPI